MISNKEIFSSIADRYDKNRKYLIPCFDDFYSIIVELIIDKYKYAKILDVGAGTGLLTNFIYHVYPDASFTLIDFSEKMLNMAVKRFNNKNNFKYIVADYSSYEFKEKYDVVVSALSIHHLDNPKKIELYNKIFSILNKNGIFINGDQVCGLTDSNEKKYQSNWKNKIENTLINNDEKLAAYERMKIDKPATLNNNLNWLNQAGFNDVDIFYKYYNFCVIYGKKY